VLGPDQIPAITDPQYAAVWPELATLAFMAHGERDEVAKAFVEGVRHTKREHATQYYEYAKNISAPELQHILEEIMGSTPWLVETSFAREHFGRGKAEGEAEAILTVLSARGVEVSDASRARITTCSDLDQLKIWASRAATAETTDDLFQ
jgi:hypothetical protein